MSTKYAVHNRSHETRKNRIMKHGTTYVQNLSQDRVPAGSNAQLNVKIKRGCVLAAQENFIHDPKSAMTAFYTISGTHNKPVLKLDTVSLPIWVNWSKNIQYQISDETYFFPHTRADLAEIVQTAVGSGKKIRVSGQRHSQAQLVTSNQATDTVLIDLACYADLGTSQTDTIQLNADLFSVTVNAGVREDELDVFLAQKNKMLPTVTAGGFFCIGGMTSIDVNGSTVEGPIFSGSATAFSVMGTDGKVSVIDTSTTCPTGYNALQFARVNVGALGVVTSITVKVLDRAYQNTIDPDIFRDTAKTADEFVSIFTNYVQNDRIEAFLNPYSQEFLSLTWNIVTPDVPLPNDPDGVPTACDHADKDSFGAPYLSPIAEIAAQEAAQEAQKSGSVIFAKVLNLAALATIEDMFHDAAEIFTDLWLTKAARTMFMSYFVELPNLGDEGLRKVWKGLNAVMTRLTERQDFLLAAPLEFRFMKGGDTALAGTFSTTPGSYFVNLDMIGFVPQEAGSEYPDNLKSFFADIEREWVALGGLPHNGKMFGFYDPTDASSISYTAPFNDNFLKTLAGRRTDRLKAFESFRATRDPKKVFSNEYVSKLLGTI